MKGGELRVHLSEMNRHYSYTYFDIKYPDFCLGILFKLLTLLNFMYGKSHGKFMRANNTSVKMLTYQKSF